MRELGRHAPSVLVLEDVHWADEATLDVVRLLGRKVEGVPALVVVSYRDELDRVHPLRVLTGELSTSQAVTRLRVDPLSPEAVARLAEPHGVDADGSLPEDWRATRSSSRRCWRRRRGDPEHGPGRGPRPGGAFEPRGAGPARGRRRRPASRRALAVGGARARGRRSRRGVPRLRDAELGSGRCRLPPRTRSVGDRGVTPAGPAHHPASEGARSARGSA